MNGRILYVIAILLGLVIGPLAEAQNQSLIIRDSVVSDRVLGIAFLRIAPLSGNSSRGYTMLLESATGAMRYSTVRVSVSQGPFVDLSGSYGGRLNLDSPATGHLMDNIVGIDTLFINGLTFRREYWAVYAGMGMWEGVINCYASRREQYYTLSLNSDISAGKPGEIEAGQTLDEGKLRSRVSNALRDPREPIVQKFNALLQSFHVSQ